MRDLVAIYLGGFVAALLCELQTAYILRMSPSVPNISIWIKLFVALAWFLALPAGVIGLAWISRKKNAA